MDLLLLKVPFTMHIVSVLWVLSAVILILVILIQKGRGTGLSGALGGGMASGILGTKTGDFLTWVTVGLISVLLLLTIAMAKFYRPTATGAVMDEPAARTQPAEPLPPIQSGETPEPMVETDLPAEGQDMPDMADAAGPAPAGPFEPNQN
jgi:preprotein translocase subunit SecG